MTWVNSGKLQGLLCTPVSEAVRLGRGPDRECCQGSGRKLALSLMSLGRAVSAVRQAAASDSSCLRNAANILLRAAASLVWVSWSQGVKGQP